MRELRVWRKEKGIISNLDSQIEKVMESVRALIDALPDIVRGDTEKISDVRSTVYRLKRESEGIAGELERQLLNRSLDKVDKGDLLRLVFHFKAIADHAEASADELHRVSFAKLSDPLKEAFLRFSDLVGQTAVQLQEASRRFERSNRDVVEMGEKVSFLENQTDEERRRLMDMIHSSAPPVSMPGFYSLMKLINSLENIADSSEEAANTLRVIAIARM